MAFISIVIQSIVFVYGLYDFDHYTISVDRSIVVYVADILSMAFIRSIAIIIVIESWLKRSLHIEFLTRIDQIDTITRNKLWIDLRYNLQQRKFFRKLFIWIGAQLSLELAVVVMASLVQLNVLQIYWLLYTVPLFMCLMRYQQFISYVELLHDRFKVLNQYIESLTMTEIPNHSDPEIPTNSNDDRHQNISQSQTRNFSRIRQVEAFVIHNKLIHLQRTHRLLIEANVMLCHLFNWSMLLNMGNDFFNVLINLYWVIINFVRNDSKLELIGIFAWGMFNITMLVTVSKACHWASYEVND